MENKDLKKEQVSLLGIERDIKKIAVKMAALTATSGVVSLGIANAQMDTMKQSIVDLAENTAKLHETAQNVALDKGMQFMEANGGAKNDPPAVVEAFKSILGLG